MQIYFWRFELSKTNGLGIGELWNEDGEVLWLTAKQLILIAF